MPYVEKDVSRDQAAAQEMMKRSGQMGVPVITVDDQVVVGFDEQRLAQLVGRGAAGPRLGAAVAPREGGLLIGRVDPGSPSAKAGLKPGDIILDVNGSVVTTADQLQDAISGSGRGRLPSRIRFRRGDVEHEALLELGSA